MSRTVGRLQLHAINKPNWPTPWTRRRAHASAEKISLDFNLHKLWKLPKGKSVYTCDQKSLVRPVSMETNKAFSLCVRLFAFRVKFLIKFSLSSAWTSNSSKPICKKMKNKLANCVYAVPCHGRLTRWLSKRNGKVCSLFAHAMRLFN